MGTHNSNDCNYVLGSKHGTSKISEQQSPLLWQTSSHQQPTSHEGSFEGVQQVVNPAALHEPVLIKKWVKYYTCSIIKNCCMYMVWCNHMYMQSTFI